LKVPIASFNAGFNPLSSKSDMLPLKDSNQDSHNRILSHTLVESPQQNSALSKATPSASIIILPNNSDISRKSTDSETEEWLAEQKAALFGNWRSKETEIQSFNNNNVLVNLKLEQNATTPTAETSHPGQNDAGQHLKLVEVDKERDPKDITLHDESKDMLARSSGKPLNENVSQNISTTESSQFSNTNKQNSTDELSSCDPIQVSENESSAIKLGERNGQQIDFSDKSVSVDAISPQNITPLRKNSNKSTVSKIECETEKRKKGFLGFSKKSSPNIVSTDIDPHPRRNSNESTVSKLEGEGETEKKKKGFLGFSKKSSPNIVSTDIDPHPRRNSNESTVSKLEGEGETEKKKKGFLGFSKKSSPNIVSTDIDPHPRRNSNESTVSKLEGEGETEKKKKGFLGFSKKSSANIVSTDNDPHPRRNSNESTVSKLEGEGETQKKKKGFLGFSKKSSPNIVSAENDPHQRRNSNESTVSRLEGEGETEKKKKGFLGFSKKSSANIVSTDNDPHPRRNSNESTSSKIEVEGETEKKKKDFLGFSKKSRPDTDPINKEIHSDKLPLSSQRNTDNYQEELGSESKRSSRMSLTFKPKTQPLKDGDENSAMVSDSNLSHGAACGSAMNIGKIRDSTFASKIIRGLHKSTDKLTSIKHEPSREPEKIVYKDIKVESKSRRFLNTMDLNAIHISSKTDTENKQVEIKYPTPNSNGLMPFKTPIDYVQATTKVEEGNARFLDENESLSIMENPSQLENSIEQSNAQSLLDIQTPILIELASPIKLATKDATESQPQVNRQTSSFGIPEKPLYIDISESMSSPRVLKKMETLAEMRNQKPLCLPLLPNDTMYPSKDKLVSNLPRSVNWDEKENVCIITSIIPSSIKTESRNNLTIKPINSVKEEDIIWVKNKVEPKLASILSSTIKVETKIEEEPISEAILKELTYANEVNKNNNKIKIDPNDSSILPSNIKTDTTVKTDFISVNDETKNHDKIKIETKFASILPGSVKIEPKIKAESISELNIKPINDAKDENKKSISNIFRFSTKPTEVKEKKEDTSNIKGSQSLSNVIRTQTLLESTNRAVLKDKKVDIKVLKFCLECCESGKEGTI
jgi:hypothetical protein